MCFDVSLVLLKLVYSYYAACKYHERYLQAALKFGYLAFSDSGDLDGLGIV